MTADNASNTSLPNSTSSQLPLFPAQPTLNPPTMRSTTATLTSAPPSPVPGARPLSAAPSSVSLSAHYLPQKFSSSMLSPHIRRRKPKAPKVPKMGGGVEAFKSGESRMPGEGDEDYDGWEGGGGRKRWNKFKWAMVIANACLSGYALTTLILLLLTHFNISTHADIIRVGNRPELILSTIACSLALFTSTIGWAGILLNNRTFLAVYAFLLWVVFALVAAPGYITYKKRTFNLEGKINAQWSRDLGASGRLRIQNQLGCCGYFSPYVEATISQTCYARTVLPGCKAPYIDFEKRILKEWYTWAFSLLAVHAAIMITALLSANHVTYRFGKGMMPKAYRLSMGSMAVIMDNYATQLAEQYGVDLPAGRMELGAPGGYRDSTTSTAVGGSLGGVPTLGYKDGPYKDVLGGTEKEEGGSRRNSWLGTGGGRYESVGDGSPTEK